MKHVCIIALCFAFGCSQNDAGNTQQESSDLTTLDQLVYVDASSITIEHPLVCGTGRDFPDGRESVFTDPESRNFTHAVFPAGVTPPETFDGSFVLHGRYQGIQNWQNYTVKKPPEDYQYFVVSSWEQNKEE